LSQTLSSVLKQVASRLEAANLHFGHGTDNAWDEACWLVAAVLDLPLDFAGEAAGRPIADRHLGRIDELVTRRIQTREPLAYLLGHAWLCGLRFAVSNEVLVPRSPLAECIIEGFEPWLPERLLRRAVDMGTGSGCLAVVLAHAWPAVRVDALDLSCAALALARQNVREHGLDGRVRCLASDLFSAVADQRYDLILSNPPYVPTASMACLPGEYRHEPVDALEAGADGLAVVRRLLIEAADHLHEHGILVCEVGEAAPALDELLGPAVAPLWLDLRRGGEGVFLMTRQACRKAARHLSGAAATPV